MCIKRDESTVSSEVSHLYPSYEESRIKTEEYGEMTTCQIQERTLGEKGETDVPIKKIGKLPVAFVIKETFYKRLEGM